MSKQFIGAREFRDAVTLRTEGTLDEHAVTRNQVWANAKEIYVDAVSGDDTASGDSGDPIQTIKELCKRVPPKGTTQVWLAAGVYVLPNLFQPPYGCGQTILGGENVKVNGAHTVLDSFLFASMATNVITAQGTPNWTIDEHVGKQVRWDPYIGGAYEGLIIRLKEILSNTANTLTVAYSTSLIGGSGSPPTVDTGMDIVELASTIRASHVNSACSALHIAGAVAFYEVRFDDGGTGAYHGLLSKEHCFLTMENCEVDGFDTAGPNINGRLYINGGIFRNMGAAAFTPQSTSINGDIYLESLSRGFAMYGAGAAMVAGYFWAKGVSGEIYQVQEGYLIEDYNYGYWLDNVGHLVRLDGFGSYLKHSVALVGFDPTHRAFNTAVVHFITTATPSGNHNRVGLYDNGNMTLTPEATFFDVDGTYYSLADYIANGSDAEFAGGNRVIG